MSTYLECSIDVNVIYVEPYIDNLILECDCGKKTCVNFLSDGMDVIKTTR